MRINIRTNGKVKDKDVRALYMIDAALDISSQYMKIANLNYFADKLGYELKKKQNG